MNRFRQGCAVALLLCGMTGAAWADIRVEVRESVNDAEPVPVVHWFGASRTLRDDGNRFIITRVDQGKTYIVDREKRQYRVVPLNLDEDGDVPDVSIERTEDTREIGEWSAHRYRIAGPATRDLTIDIWIADDVDVDVSAFRRLMVRLGDRPGSEWLKAYAEIDGFPVLQQVELERPGIRLRSESRVVEIEETEPPPGTYSPPDDYERTR
ncbi:DUF4412 domain-containing protein [Salinisphaera sp. PC39]|uniref:DUF4412 domain-containing protein n=1 Tax=Salinisphaera sp. PC39 TaxID=1304156 RepID=UPI003342D642